MVEALCHTSLSSRRAAPPPRIAAAWLISDAAHVGDAYNFLE
jgi:hypothetical protein